MYFRKSHVCANKLDVQETKGSDSHCSTEHEIISLDAGLRMDGIPALAVWDLVLEVFHAEPNKADGPKREPWRNPSPITKSNMHNSIPIKNTNVIPTNIDHIPSNTMYSDSSAVLYVFDGNEALIKMIIKSRRPTIRHVSRTHRVALDWLFDRINLHLRIQIRYSDSNHQLADNFTRDEWNNLWCLFNISHFSSTCYTQNSSLISCSTVAKRIQNEKEEERVVSESRPAVMKTSSYFIATSSSTASNRIASKKRPGMPIASETPHSRMSVEPSSFDAASTS